MEKNILPLRSEGSLHSGSYIGEVFSTWKGTEIKVQERSLLNSGVLVNTSRCRDVRVGGSEG